MRISKTNKFTTYTMLFLAVGLLFGCKPIFEKKPLPPKDDQAATAPATPAAEPAPTPAAESTPIEDVQSLESIESTDEAAAAIEEESASVAAVEVADDGDDIVKTTPALMKKIQQALVDAGLNPGPVDGVSGAKTVAAIESFQKQNDITPGKITKRTLRTLGVAFE
ncbi:peptidoglycan-binding protein [Nitrosomonas sp. sh817]|uniref:peptidoglycan-binding domain-containing protein n=1 Tax=unclassified Nitrosomonas TaxID=2609265 RepID=UPI0027DC48CC|nr:peptidoglycan-binding domain-containing protein [Nitrosomonas sp. sh817]WMJ08438.1 peptidoglycan-binding domain-containing protein [Nitrosomonas sp. sh817]